MKKYGWMTLGCAVLLSSAAVIHGQSQTLAVAVVPFSFNVGDVRLPAATYRLNEVNTTGTTQMQNAENGHSVIIAALVPKGSEAKDSKLVFRCYQGNCFLAEIWYQGEASGHALKPGKREKEVAQAGLNNVIVAMR